MVCHRKYIFYVFNVVVGFRAETLIHFVQVSLNYLEFIYENLKY